MDQDDSGSCLRDHHLCQRDHHLEADELQTAACGPFCQTPVRQPLTLLHSWGTKPLWAVCEGEKTAA